jgi:hypothetical protein
MEIRDRADRRNLIRFDGALKRLLRNRANVDVLEGVLTVPPEENVTIRNSGEKQQNRYRKTVAGDRSPIASNYPYRLRNPETK